MEEDRKNLIYNEIVSGLKFLTLGGIRYKIVTPSRETRLLAEHIYQEVLSSLRFDNLMTDAQCQQALMRLGVWSPVDDESLKKLEKLLEDQKVRLFKSNFDLDSQKNIRRQLAGTKKAIERSLGRKHSLDLITLRRHAFTVKSKFILAMSLRDEEGREIYDEKSFWNSDSTVLERVYQALETSIITVE